MELAGSRKAEKIKGSVLRLGGRGRKHKQVQEIQTKIMLQKM